jgi:hypothetical protein
MYNFVMNKRQNEPIVTYRRSYHCNSNDNYLRSAITKTKATQSNLAYMQQVGRKAVSTFTKPTAISKETTSPNTISSSLPPSPSPPAQQVRQMQNLSLSNCNLFNPRKVMWSYNTSRRWLNHAIPRIRQFLRAPHSQIVRDALTDNFHTTNLVDIRTILANYDKIQIDLFIGRIVDCLPQSCMSGDLAWVINCGTLLGAPYRRVHICPGFWSCTNQYKIGGTFIHEAAHTENCALDHAYEQRSNYASLNPSDAIENADSYAVAARQIYHNGAHGPGESC